MSRRIFMKKLMMYLKNISDDERESIKDFYEEMLDDANIGLDDEVPESFGNPRKIAMEILAENIEFEEQNETGYSKSKRNKSREFFKKLSFVSLGLLSLPVALPIVVILAVIFALALAVGVIVLVFSILSLPITIWFAPFFVFKVLGWCILFVILTYIFVECIKLLSKFFVKKVSENPTKYSKYVKEKYNSYDDEDEFFTENIFENESRSFKDITELKCEFSASNIIFEIIEADTLSVDATDFKNSKLVYEIRGTRLILFNKNLKFKMKKRFNMDDKFVKNSTIHIYIPRDINLYSKFNASNVKFNFVELDELTLESNASNIKFKTVEAETVNCELNASNVKGNVDFEFMKIESNASNVRLEVEKQKEDIIYSYSVNMGRIEIFGESFTGIGKSKTENISNLEINCSAGNVVIE
ncbi:MAG: DUF1700 domain-containing protein [Peptoniphilaceae bacterium]|uniref:HAAS signaling domain-containing protein n=1 Tax=Parvimonas sp. TaxID=1944660 RepID=UPI002A761E22|nr:DUF1700 domain-containing protein [Parvimonas sp.]MDD7764565.1 DUF1700 domain-containing protein [Peptoniphilaceae bacterium]MDY3050543.1 DUF1700 domain-containing protein [Parvimonas sp.]